MLIRYFTGLKEYARLTRDNIPRIGDEIRFNGEIYKIISIVWIEDEAPERVHIEIKKLNVKPPINFKRG